MTALRVLIGATFCSGIGAPEVAAPWVDWRLASEIEPFPRAVLQHRFGYRAPAEHNQGEPYLHDDMTTITPDLFRARGIPLPDIIVAGTPCQDFSVAGLRAGIAGDRGNLTIAFVEILHGIAQARPDGRLAALWENVPGVLSDKGNAFGCFLGGIVGAMDALPCPAGGTWPREGMVEGPRARAAWATLDSQWFGVAQRRERVFVVVDIGGAVDPAAVLLEPDRLRGDTPPRREKGEVAPTIPARSLGGGGLGTDFDCDGGLIHCADVASALNAAFGSKLGLEDQHINSGAPLFVSVAHALRAEGFDASEDGTGRGTPIVPVAPTLRAGGNLTGGHRPPGTDVDTVESLIPMRESVSGPLTAGMHKSAARMPQEQGTLIPEPLGFSAVDSGGDAQDGLAPTLRAMGHASSHPNAGGHAAVAFDLRGRDGGAMPEGPHDTANIRAASGGSSRSYVALPWAVRRLTPTECARLQHFPDDHTQIPWRGKPADQCPDGPQYKAYGNSMTTSVVRWIMDRMRISMMAAAQWAGPAEREAAHG